MLDCGLSRLGVLRAFLGAAVLACAICGAAGLASGQTASSSAPPADAGSSARSAAPLAQFTFTQLSGAAPATATYQSHNQLIVANRKGIFVIFLDSDPDPQEVPRQNSWTLMRSVDEGKTFTALYRAAGHAASPGLETDEDDNVYVFVSDIAESGGNPNVGMLVIYKFRSDDDSDTPEIAKISLEKFVDKFTPIYDRTRQQFYFAPYLDVPFLTLDKSGRVLRSVRLFSPGPNALLEYPRLSLDGDRLHLAWTTATPVKPWRYYSIHAIASDDGGLTWSSPATGPLKLPAVSDDTGPIPPIARNAWLAAFSVVDGISHFMYRSEGRETYRRIRAETGRPEAEPAEPWEADGLGISSLDGFFSVHERKHVLYAVGADDLEQDAQGRAPIVVLRSSDNGKTWQAHAKSERLYRPYAIGGPRYSFDETGLIGVFTNYVDRPGDPSASEVYFFRVPL